MQTLTEVELHDQTVPWDSVLTLAGATVWRLWEIRLYMAKQLDHRAVGILYWLLGPRAAWWIGGGMFALGLGAARAFDEAISVPPILWGALGLQWLIVAVLAALPLGVYITALVVYMANYHHPIWMNAKVHEDEWYEGHYGRVFLPPIATLLMKRIRALASEARFRISYVDNDPVIWARSSRWQLSRPILVYADDYYGNAYEVMPPR